MMKGTIVPKKFRSIRDKTGSHRRNKSSEPGQKSRPVTAEALFSVFRTETQRQAAKEKEEEEKEASKVEDIAKRLEELNIRDVATEHIKYVLAGRYAAGNADKAVELISQQQKAFAGIVEPYNPNVGMLGAENRGNVTCYLDALLFAMFAKLEAFECMLRNDPANESQRKLAALIRLWVNMLRSGKFITTDLVQQIQEALSECGWKDAALLEQQDTSEAFAFITETLQLPLLTLQVDLFHQGKRDDDDHKVVYERLLNLAVPPDPEGKGIQLEDCLEEYFNTQVDVLRDSLDEKKSLEKTISEPKSTIRLVLPEGAETVETIDHAEVVPLARRWTTQNAVVESPISLVPNEEPIASSSDTKPEHASDRRPAPRHRSTSVFQRIVLDDKGQPTESDSRSLLQKAMRTGSTVVKAVTIPAWQFYKLIPWHAASSSEPRNDIDVARQFNQRPVVGICLKRYMMTENGVFKRHNTFIDIPDSLRLPHFMLVDDAQVLPETVGLSQEYKLVLQSVVCHRGDSLHSGHYISFARVAPKLLTDNRRQEHDPPPDYEEAQWVKFDDLHLEQRVSYVDDIRQALKDEMPYLLFYQILPMVDFTTASTNGSVEEPPSYDENPSVKLGDAPSTPLLDAASEQAAVSRSTSGYFDSPAIGSTGPSIRFSTELERPTRLSLDEDPMSSSSFLKVGLSRRGSVTLSESTAPTPGITPEGVSPAITPVEESTGTRLSRAAIKFAKSGSKSRPTSQAGEGRISLTMSRLGGLMRQSKEPLREEGGSSSVGTAGDGSEELAIIINQANLEDASREKEHHHHLHHHGKKDKDRAKSKGRGDKERDKERGKAKEKQDVPDRECAVM